MAHPTEDILEQYNLRGISAPLTEQLEKHFLECEACRVRCLKIALQIAAIQEALTAYKAAEPATAPDHPRIITTDAAKN